jgi:hypothetical protein
LHGLFEQGQWVKRYFHGAEGSTTAGLVECPPVFVGNSVEPRSLSSLCPLNTGGNFGRIELVDVDPDGIRPFAAHSRVESVSGNGFSVEGLTIGSFANNPAYSYVLGLRRQSAPPGYSTNCFVGSLGEAVDVMVVLRTSPWTELGRRQVNLGPGQMIRALDVFDWVGAPSGDHANVYAEFVAWNNNASVVAFCTVQNNSTFGAEFLLARTPDPSDLGRRVYQGGRDGLTLENLMQLSAGTEDVFRVFWQQPDKVSCGVSSAGFPGALFLAVLDPDGALVAGGQNVEQTGNVSLPVRSTNADGMNGAWKIVVGSRSGGAASYILWCHAGNGGSAPLRVGSLPHGATLASVSRAVAR